MRKCIDCGETSTGQRCSYCRAEYLGTAKWQTGSDVVLEHGHWFNDRGIMRWVAS